MSFPMPVLDDRTFQDIVDEAKRRIPHHTPEWTDHNLSDPGVALIELFAWMTESLIYRLNQVPDHMYRSFLELVGIRPYAPRPATTPVTFWITPGDARTHPVPPGQRVATTQDPVEGSIDFLTTTPLVIRQPELSIVQRLQSGAEPSFDDSLLEKLERNGRNEDPVADDEIECFTNLEVGEAVYFGFAESLAANVLHIDISATIHGTGVNPHQPPLIWEVSVDHDEWAPAEMDPGGDTTFGLNAHGRVLLYLPFEHTEELHGAHRAYWLRVRLTDATPGYAESPRLTRVGFQSLGGRAIAEQGIGYKNEELGRSTAKPGQVFHLQHPPILDRYETETITVIPPIGEPEEWTEVENFALTQADDRHFTLDSASGEIRFGPRVSERDGTVRHHGAIPEADARIVMTGYRSGGGRRGNVAPDSIVVLRSPLDFVQRVNNRLAGTGGIDAETVENAKIRGPLALVTGDRAVTAEDFEHLTTSMYPEIARASCQASRSYEDPISLFVIAAARTVAPQQLTVADLLVDRVLLEDLKETLDERRLIGTMLEISPPAYRGVSVVVHIVADSHHQPTSVRERCLDALYNYINPLTGGPQGTGWPWGVSPTRAQVVQLLRSVPGVSEIKQTLFFNADYTRESGYRTAVRTGEGRDKFELGEHELPVSALHQVVVDASAHPDPTRPTTFAPPTGEAEQ